MPKSPFPFAPPPTAMQLLPFALASSLNASGGSLTKFHLAPQPHTQSTHWSNNRKYLSLLSPSLFGPPRNRTSSSVGWVWGSTIPSRCAMHSAAIANGLGRAGATSGLPTLRSRHHISPFTQSVSWGGVRSKAGHVQISSAVMAGKLPENLARYQWNCSTVGVSAGVSSSSLHQLNRRSRQDLHKITLCVLLSPANSTKHSSYTFHDLWVIRAQ